MNNDSADGAEISLIYYPHRTLKFPAKPVTRVDGDLLRLIDEMFDIMYESRGVGLAANQINVPLRIFVMDPTGERDSGQKQAFINPVISRRRGDGTDEEGCLSIPGIRANVRRSTALHLSAYSQRGEAVEQDLDGFAARIAQHEVDHLDGVLFIDRIDALARKSLQEELAELERQFQVAEAAGSIDQSQEHRDDWLRRYAS